MKDTIIVAEAIRMLVDYKKIIIASAIILVIYILSKLLKKPDAGLQREMDEIIKKDKYKVKSQWD